MQTRRDFLKSGTMGLVGTSTIFNGGLQAQTQFHTVQPTRAQKNWMEHAYGMFIHFGPNTLQGVGWGDGKFPAEEVVFPKIDVTQWVAVARDAGMKYAVLTTKHHDGFCLWPSAHTEYSVRNSPQHLDIVGEFVNACRNAGVKPGFYYSTWDRHCPFYEDDQRYAEYMRNQISELARNYGDVFEWWFDGSWDKDHPTRKWEYNPEWENDASLKSLRGERYEWKKLYTLIHQLQPGTIVLHNSSSDRPGRIKYLPCDARTAEHFDFVMRDKIIEPVTDPVVTVNGKQVYLPLEFEASITPGWFWNNSAFINHPSVATIVDWYQRARSVEANLLLNVGPNNLGLIPHYNVSFLLKAEKLISMPRH